MRVGGVQASWKSIMGLWMRVVLMIRTSKSCVVRLIRVADTMVFGRVQRIGPIVIFFKRDIWRIRELRFKLGVSFFYRVDKGAR